MCNNKLPEGFIPWYGGDNPVPGKRVKVMLRDYISDEAASAAWRWIHHNNSSDIIAYKIDDDQPSTAPFSTKFVIGKEYKTRDGYHTFKLGAIVPESTTPLIFINKNGGRCVARPASGNSKYGSTELDIVLNKRTVYVNLYKTGFSWWYDTAPQAEHAVGKKADQCVAVAVPVEVEQ